ncbi:MAG: energy transducer TonB [Steroidobacteraceae bacterium]
MTSERTWDWVDRLAHRLIHRAARSAPESLSERLEEEWLADLSAQRGPVARLLFAAGCCRAINVISRELAVAAPAAAGSSGQGAYLRPSQDDFPLFTGRTITFVLVASLHAALLYGLAMGLGPKFTRIITGPLETHIVQPPPRSSLPPPPRPKLSPTKLELPPPEIMPQIESDPDVPRAVPTDPPLPPTPPTGPTVVNRVQGGPGTGFPSTAEFYPDASIRMGEKGAATVKVCVDAKGRLTSAPTMVESSESARLDEAALRLAQAGSGHYRASTEDGQPVYSCYPFRIRFELRN